jgi:hypothetical protein
MIEKRRWRMLSEGIFHSSLRREDNLLPSMSTPHIAITGDYRVETRALSTGSSITGDI